MPKIKSLLFKALNRFAPRSITDFYVLNFMNMPMKLTSKTYTDFAGLSKDCHSYSHAEVIDWYLRDFRALKFASIDERHRMFLAALSSLLAEEKSFTILDFGGGFGQDYFLFKHFIGLERLERYFLCENEAVVGAFKKVLENEKKLTMISDIQEIPPKTRINFIYLSGTLQYLEKPHDTLARLLDLQPDFLFLNRFPSWNQGTMLTKQLRPR